jgi:hypothetical protein
MVRCATEKPRPASIEREVTMPKAFPLVEFLRIAIWLQTAAFQQGYTI